MASMETLSMKLPRALLTRLDQESRVRRTSRSSLVRQAIERELSGPASGVSPTCFDLAADLAGAISGLPKDLATNPKYLKDFGR